MAEEQQAAAVVDMTGVVVAVSVAKPQWQEMFGRQVFSSIVRTAADGPIRFGPGGPDGNATAVHTEAVFAFFAEHYDYWAEKLGADRQSWSDCFWGENLMLTGLAEDRVHVGDRFRVGGALLEVTSPRVPCFKVAWRLGQPERFVADLSADGRMGCYLRVIEPGLIAAGDGVRRIERRPDAITVLGLSRLLSDPAIADVGLLQAAAATPGIGGQASEMLRKRITFLVDGQLGRRNRWQGWRRFRIDAIVEEAAGVRSFHLAPVDGGAIADYRAGQFLTVRLPDSAGAPVRTWSLSDFAPEGRSYRLSIKHEPGGAASTFLHERALPGMELEVRPPSGRFVLDRGGLLRTVLISAGIGVTPMLAMLKAHAARTDKAPPLLWLHAARSGAEHAFAAEAATALARIPDATARIFYSSPAADDVAERDYHRSGRIDEAAIEALLDESYAMSPFGREIVLTGENSIFYICGPASFQDMVRDVLTRRGVNPAQIQSESFGRAASAATAGAAYPERAEVRLLRSARSLTWLRDDDLSLLDLLETNGIAAESGCRMGNCGTCEVALAAGRVDGPEHAGAGRVLLCCSRPLTTDLAIDI